MKNAASLFVLFAFLFQSCGTKKEECADACCKKENTSSTVVSTGNSVIADTSKGLSCKLTTADLQKRRETVLVTLKTKILEKKELKDGYSFRFQNSDEVIDMLTTFIKSERECCDFFNFSMHVRNDGTLWFDLTRPKEAKEIITAELNL
ncbi:MAG: hypothetical protein H0W61_14030 [Bacteroidetes bacterium]|nr:hypothetical protein [Bacteroidota bacterium]